MKTLQQILLDMRSDVDDEDYGSFEQFRRIWPSEARVIDEYVPKVTDALLPTRGVARISVERRRQIRDEHFTLEHDVVENRIGDLALAAICYLACATDLEIDFDHIWPWDLRWFKPGTIERDLERAGALVAAELDRRDSEPAPEPESVQERVAQIIHDAVMTFAFESGANRRPTWEGAMNVAADVMTALRESGVLEWESIMQQVRQLRTELTGRMPIDEP